MTISDDFKVGPSVEPRTKDEALALAQAWGRTLSHWNDCANGSPDDKAHAIAECASADAAEVQRLAALWTMLPGEQPASAAAGDLRDLRTACRILRQAGLSGVLETSNDRRASACLTAWGAVAALADERHDDAGPQR